jgi:hypothetical protein
LLALLLLLLASCGGLPQPFAGNSGETALRLAQPPPARLAVLPSADASLTPAQSANLASWLAEALQGQEVPAAFLPPQPGDWRLVTTIARQDGTVTPMFTVFDPAGVQAGIAQGQSFSPESWEEGGTLRRVAATAAPDLLGLLTRIDAARRASDPASLSNRAARLRVPDVTGAPGDGNRQLARRMREQLNLQGLTVLDDGRSDPADFSVAGQVRAVPIAGQMERIEIQWIVTDTTGDERSRVVQLNEIPAGTLDRFWGDVALVVAQEAAGGVKDAILQQTGRKAPGKPAP